MVAIQNRCRASRELRFATRANACMQDRPIEHGPTLAWPTPRNRQFLQIDIRAQPYDLLTGAGARRSRRVTARLPACGKATEETLLAVAPQAAESSQQLFVAFHLERRVNPSC